MRMMMVLIALALLATPDIALADAVADRVAALEKDVATARSMFNYVTAALAVMGIGSVAAVMTGARWVRTRVRDTFDRSLKDVGLDLAQLSALVSRGELTTRIRRESVIVVVSEDGRRNMQVVLQQEGFRKVTAHKPGQQAVEAARIADLVVCEGWGVWAEQLVRDLGRDDVLVFTGPARIDVPKDLAGQIMLANTHLTLGLHSAALLARADARRG